LQLQQRARAAPRSGVAHGHGGRPALATGGFLIVVVTLFHTTFWSILVVVVIIFHIVFLTCPTDLLICPTDFLFDFFDFSPYESSIGPKGAQNDVF